jgi:thiol-disulfide isomerase/thioredoxin
MMQLRLSLVVSALFAALALGACGDSDRAPSGLDADPWAPMSEDRLRARIDEARAEARASDRRVLLDFIATWCEDCREVVRLSHDEPARAVLEDRHRDLIRAHGVDRIATLVVLDPASGQRVAKTTLEPITGGQRGLTSADLAAWLRDPHDG